MEEMEKIYIENLGTLEVPALKVIDYENEKELPYWDMEMDHIPEEVQKQIEEDQEDMDGWL